MLQILAMGADAAGYEFSLERYEHAEAKSHCMADNQTHTEVHSKLWFSLVYNFI